MTDPNPAQRRDMWFSNNFEAWTPTDPDERTAYLSELADEANNGPAQGQEQP